MTESTRGFDRPLGGDALTLIEVLQIGFTVVLVALSVAVWCARYVGLVGGMLSMVASVAIGQLPGLVASFAFVLSDSKKGRGRPDTKEP